MEKYLVVIEKSKTGYAASSPDVPGCVATASSIEKVVSRMKKALLFHFEGLAEDGDPIPRAKGVRSYRRALREFAGSTFFLTHVPVDVSRFQELAHAE